MGVKATEVGGNQLLEFEIERYREVLAGTAETHRYVFAGSDEVFEDVYIPEGVTFNANLEHSLMAHTRRLYGLRADQIEYVGPINTEQALGAIMIRRQAMQLENAPAAVGAYYIRPGDKVAA